MARPKVFLSSTYFDLRQVRADIERFINDHGYDSILNEHGNIAYGKEEKLEDYCYKEINNIDILVSIIGGRFGSESKNSEDSISQTELKTAYDLNKQVYIFIDKNVYSEYKFYANNKDNESIKFVYADDIKIYKFIEYVETLPNNNTIHAFETSMDIVNFLKEQWAGLFQRFLQEQPRVKEINLIKGVENTAKTLDQLVTFLTEEKKDKDNAINEILLSGHPAMLQIKSLLGIPFRVYFTTKDELDELLNAYGYTEINSEADFDLHYSKSESNQEFEIVINFGVFVDNKLKVYTREEWDETMITLTITDDDDDLPF